MQHDHGGSPFGGLRRCRFPKARPENRNRWNAHLPRDFNAQCLFSAKGGGMYGLERALFFALVIALVVVGIVAIAPSIL